MNVRRSRGELCHFFSDSLVTAVAQLSSPKCRGRKTTVLMVEYLSYVVLQALNII